jgi:hypothetical protein
MPQIPGQTTQTVFGQPPGGDYLNVQASPEAFGSQVAQEGRRLGGVVSDFGDLAQHAVKFQQQQNEAEVDQSNSLFEQQKRDQAAKFYSLQGKDAVDAYKGTSETIEDLRQSVKNGLGNREQQRMFDYISRRSTDSELYRMSVHAAGQNKEWLKTTAVGAINNEINNSATYWNDDTQFANSMGNIKLQAEKLVRLQGIDPDSEAGKVAVTHYQGEAWQARIRSVMQQSPDVAREMFDANADQIDAAHRSTLDSQITQHQYMFASKQAAQEQRDQARAEHFQKLAQQETFSTVFADAMNGKFDPQRASDLVRAQVITPEQALAAQNESVKATEARGHSPDEFRLWIALANGSAGPNQIAAGAGPGGTLSAETAAQMGKFWAEKQQGLLRLTDEQNWDSVSDSIGAKALSMGINLFGMDEKVHAQIISQARTEWTRRVIVGKEDSFKVAEDLRQKYAPMVSDTRMLPRPKVGGDIVDRNTLNSAAAALKDAVNNGRMAPGDANDQAALLNRYKNLFDLQEKNAAKKPAPSVEGSGKKAKVLGIEPAQ